MKKLVLVLLLSLFMISGCGKEDNIKDVYKKVSEYFENDDNEKSNLISFYLDEENNVVVVTLILNSTDFQTDFIRRVKVDSKYIRFEQSSNSYSNIDFYISKPLNYNDIKFNDYFKLNDRTIYIASYIDEFYVVDNGNINTLKDYVSFANQSFENSIEKITNKLIRKDILKDGGTTIYKLEEKDITMVVCNTLDNNKDIYIGNYVMEYEENMCVSL